MTPPLLSIIIPAHNEEERLPPSLLQVKEFVNAQSYEIEVIVVENGSHDRTFEVASSFIAEMPYLRVINEKMPGKGLAVRTGILAATGIYRIFCDADFSMPVAEINKFVPTNGQTYDVAIASRELPESKRVNEPEYRHLIGRIFNSMVRFTVLPGLQDTQCGFKAFRGEVADQVFPIQTLVGWSFDAEVLVIARQNGYKIEEVPITWYYKPGTRLNIVRDSIRMALDLLTIRRNARRGYYVRSQKTL
ncbi:MAG: glycosyl transferase [Chloroflexi bacterium 44-23]|nr:MAG: glycosyl transferase [Chloroflexi bacterium 44-23]